MQDSFYDFSKSVNPWVRIGSLVILFLAILLVILPSLYPQSSFILSLLTQIEPYVLLLFGVLFFLRALLEYNSLAFIQSKWIEALASLVALVLGYEVLFNHEILIHQLFEIVGIGNPKTLILTLIQVYLITLTLIKLVQFTPKLIAHSKKPAQLISGSFIGLIGIGTLLLVLPVATVNGEGLGVINALFMSASAVCVTGLSVVNVGNELTFFGQLCILILIQLGGLGVVTFATFLTLFTGQKLNLSHRLVLQDVVSEQDISAVTLTLKRIIWITIFFECMGTLIYFISLQDVVIDTQTRIYFAVFHAISAFCNAGFSLFPNGLADASTAYSWVINLNTILLFVIGGLGFTTVWELLTKINWSTLSISSSRLSLHTYLTLRMTAFLLVLGSILLLITEWNGVFKELSWSQSGLAAFFQSATTRTAGFNTVDTGSISAAGAIIMILLMAIGGSPASTAGGIKTTTFYVLLAAVKSTVTGNERIELRNRTIPYRIVFKAFSVVIIAFMVISLMLVLLTITESKSFLDLAFEQVSAFMTVGLSRGITAELTDWGKLNLTVSMFLGRIGFLTFALTFANRIKQKNYRYPEEDITIA